MQLIPIWYTVVIDYLQLLKELLLNIIIFLINCLIISYQRLREVRKQTSLSVERGRVRFKRSGERMNDKSSQCNESRPEIER